MEENRNECPCCGRHCDLSMPNCERGEEYARTGVIPERKGRGDYGPHGEHERHGEHGPHGEHEHHGEHGPHGEHERHGEHGLHGEHEHHGAHGPHGGEYEHHGENGSCDRPEHRSKDEHHGGRPHHGGPGRHKDFGSILDSERYAAMDEDNKLMTNIREMRHLGRFGFDGKGGQNRILRILSEDGAMTQRELTERLGIQPGSASEVLGKLEKSGLIIRSQNTADRRTTDVAVTDAGRTQAAEAAAHRDERVHEMFAVLSADEKAVLLAGLEKLNRAWKEKDKEHRRGEYGKGEKRHG